MVVGQRMKTIGMAVLMLAMACASSRPIEVRSIPIDCIDPDRVSFHEQNSGLHQPVWRGVQLFRAGDVTKLTGHDVAEIRVTEGVSRVLCDTECRKARDLENWSDEEIFASGPIAISYGSVDDALADTRYEQPITLTPYIELEFGRAGALLYRQVRDMDRPLGASLAVRLGTDVGAVLNQSQPGPRVLLSTGAEPGDFDALLEAVRQSACGENHEKSAAQQAAEPDVE